MHCRFPSASELARHSHSFQPLLRRSSRPPSLLSASDPISRYSATATALASFLIRPSELHDSGKQIWSFHPHCASRLSRDTSRLDYGANVFYARYSPSSLDLFCCTCDFILRSDSHFLVVPGSIAPRFRLPATPLIEQRTRVRCSNQRLVLVVFTSLPGPPALCISTCSVALIFSKLYIPGSLLYITISFDPSRCSKETIWSPVLPLPSLFDATRLRRLARVLVVCPSMSGSTPTTVFPPATTSRPGEAIGSLH
jgi:hypothetical protein